MNILSAAAVRELDRKAIAGGKPGIELMEAAGKGFVAQLCFGGRVANKEVTVVAGKGNNGGDGFVIARYLHAAGMAVKVVLLASESEIKGDAGRNLERLRKLPVEIIKGNSCRPAVLEKCLGEAGIIVDAIFGTGFSGAVTGRHKTVIELINRSSAFVAACDMPSGVNGDTGEVKGACAVEADITITFAYPKTGMFVLPGSLYTGGVKVVDIGLKDNSRMKKQLLTGAGIKSILKKRGKSQYKNDFGHVLVIAGSRGMTGAAALTCNAAMRAGAGLVTLGIPGSLNSVMESKLTETMTLPLPETDNQALSLSAYKVIAGFIKKRNPGVLAVGPGLSTDKETLALVRKLVNTGIPCMLDADGINAFNGKLSLLEKAKSDIIITPHPGEFARLSKMSKSAIEKNRVKVAKDFAAKNGLVAVLKGYQTVVSDGVYSYINPNGNPGMASAGTGDVLTGMIAGLVSQVKAPCLMNAARAGVFLHGLAGDLAAQKKGELSLIASDIIEEIPEALKAFQ